MSTIWLEPGETINFRTRTGGLVTVELDLADSGGRPDPDRSTCYKADCEVCHETSGNTDRTSLTKVRVWAREHAAVCTALPAKYLSAEDAALGYAERAAKLANEIGNGAEPERLMPTLDAFAKVATVFAEIARIQR